MFKHPIALAIFSLQFLATPLSAKIIKIAPPTQENCTYAELPCSEQQKAYIEELITAMGEQTWFSLFKNRNHLEAIGSHINSVHPLKFLGTIFSNPNLKTHMLAIFDDFLKKGQLMDNGLIPNLNREADKGTLSKYLNAFAEEVKIPVDALQPYVQSRDWDEMVRFLIRS